MCVCMVIKIVYLILNSIYFVLMANRTSQNFLRGLEQHLESLIEHVQLEKERVCDIFKQLHNMLTAKEESLLLELDELFILARHELKEKKQILLELESSKEVLQKELTQNKLQSVLVKNLQNLEDTVEEVMDKDISVSWVELEWNRRQFEQSVVNVCKVVSSMKKTLRTEDYSRSSPVWSRDATETTRIHNPKQLTIDTTSENILVADYTGNRVQVFDKSGNHLYAIQTPPHPIGLAVTNEFIFVSSEHQLLKIQKSNNKTVESVTTNNIRGIDVDMNSNIYGCECRKIAVIVWDKKLKLNTTISLITPHIESDTSTYSIKLYQDYMYVMFNASPFHLQIFSMDGQLIRCMIPDSEVNYTTFFAVDQFGNVITTNCFRHQIKVFSSTGELLNIISNSVLSDHSLSYPQGVDIDKNNRIVVAQRSKKCNLLVL